MKFGFQSITPMFQSYQLEVSTDTHLAWGKMHIYFGVTGVILRVKRSILGSLEVNFGGHWGITTKGIELSTSNLAQTLE